MNAVEAAKEVVLKEASALSAVAGQIGEAFERMADAMRSCTGKVVIIGMGKSGHVANKMAATLSSLGTCSISLHPGECMHGDLGMIQKQDAVILISYSGESDEIVRIIPGLKIIGAKLMGITCNAQSTLARSCEVVQVLDGIEEACHLGLAPTTSTTAVMAYGDALAVAISRLEGFSKNDFGVFHPAGSLGKRLTIRAGCQRRRRDHSHIGERRRHPAGDGCRGVPCGYLDQRGPQARHIEGLRHPGGGR